MAALVGIVWMTVQVLIWPGIAPDDLWPLTNWWLPLLLRRCHGRKLERFLAFAVALSCLRKPPLSASSE